MMFRDSAFSITKDNLLDMITTLALVIDHAPEKKDDLDAIIIDLEEALYDKKKDPKTSVLLINNKASAGKNEIEIANILGKLVNEIQGIKKTEPLSSLDILQLTEFKKLADRYLNLPLISSSDLQKKYSFLGNFVVAVKQNETNPFIENYAGKNNNNDKDKFITDNFKKIWETSKPQPKAKAK